MDVKVLPTRYQHRPVELEQVEAILLTEDNLQEVLDWLNSLYIHDPLGRRREAIIKPDPATGALRILSPFYGGLYRCCPGDYLVHFGGGQARSMSVEDFELTYEPRPSADPSLCSCITPRAHGVDTGTGTMVWAEDCQVCGRKLTPEALASVTVGQA